MLAVAIATIRFVPRKKIFPCDIHGCGGGLHVAPINAPKLLQSYCCYFVRDLLAIAVFLVVRKHQLPITQYVIWSYRIYVCEFSYTSLDLIPPFS